MKDNTNNKLGIGTLKMYAKEDNEILYNELFKSKNKFKLFDEILTTRAIGNHFKSLYGDKFVYQNGKLYYYNNVYWSVEDIKENLINIILKIKQSELFSFSIDFLEKFISRIRI